MAPTVDILSVLKRQSELAGPIERAITNLKKEHHRQLVEFRDTNADKTTRQVIDSHDYFTQSVYSTVEESFLDGQEFMESRLDAIHAEDPTTGSAMADRSMTQEEGQFQAPPLKPIELPTFSGEPRDWISYRDLFQALVGTNPRLQKVTKLHYLKASVTGVAATRIEAIKLTDDSFAMAWDYLVSVYDYKRLLVNTAMRDLMETRSPTRSCGTDLDRFTSEISRAITSLESQGQSSHHCDAYIVYIVTSKLDPDSIKEWEESLGSSQLLPTWVKLLKFFEVLARSLRAWKLAKGGSQPTTKPQQSARTHHVAVNADKPSSLAKGSNKRNQANKTNRKPCVLCAEGHFLSSCPTFRAKSCDERKAVVKTKKVCFNCLGSHRMNDCTSQGRCMQCNDKHHTHLHSPSRSATSAATSQSGSPSSHGASTSSTAAISNHAISRPGLQREVLLTTASVRIETPGAAAVLARALIDTGSELSFVSEALAQLLKLPRRRVNVPLIVIRGRSSGSTRGAVSFTVRPHFESRYRCQVNAVTLPKLTADVASRHVPTCNWTHLRGLQLADPDYSNSGRIDIILGADIYGQLLKSGVKRRPLEAPVTQSTELGWILSGPCTPARHTSLPPDDSRHVPAQGLHCAIDRTSNDNELHELVHRFWSQEETASTTSSSLSPEEEECETHFLLTHTRDSTGRYMVRLPFRSSPDALGGSHACAKRMLSRLQKRLTSDTSLQRLYCEFLGQYETLGHMKLNTDARSDSSTTFYLPHHGVLKDSSTTTKLRVVFNGSARSSSGKSINDLLHVGAKLQTNLSDVILRWRRKQFVFSADIEKMFCQINVHPEDWKYQRTLWSTDTTADAATYDLTTVTYGLGPAPFLAIRVLQQLVRDEGHRFPLAVNILTQGTYVDDTFGGADTLEEAQQAVQQLDELCKAGGILLQKWTSNYSVVLADISPSRRETLCTILLEEDSLVKTLGIAWRPATDYFEFTPFGATHHPPFTKRKVLSRIAQIFDPLG